MSIYQVNTIKNSFFGRKKMNYEAFWKKSRALTEFGYPWNSDPPPATIFRALHDKKYFYFRYDVIDTDIHADKSKNDKMAALGSDRVELFFRQDEHMRPYYGLEMDPVGRVLDYQADYYREFDYTWTWEGITIRSEYTLNGYRVWGSIPLESFRTLGLLRKNKLQAGLFRGKCIPGPEGGPAFKWISWMKPDSETPDFHIPSAFGELVLSGMK